MNAEMGLPLKEICRGTPNWLVNVSSFVFVPRIVVTEKKNWESLKKMQLTNLKGIVIKHFRPILILTEYHFEALLRTPSV